MSEPTNATVLGLGAMGGVLAAALQDAGYRTTTWNRTPGRDAELIARGAVAAPSVREAVAASPVTIACLYDHASVHETLDPVAPELGTLINVTTTTPGEARELAAWAAGHGIGYLDGAILATPVQIGSREAAILTSGSRAVYDAHRTLLDVWATSSFDGDDAGMASLHDLAMLSGMYTMFAGFLHGAAMTGSAGVPAREFAARATPFLAAMTEFFAWQAATVDDRAYQGGQSMRFTEPVLAAIARASEEQGVDPAPIAMVRSLVQEQIALGHGAADFDRIYEGLRRAEGAA
ncbi:NAD(P)-dependent oxidoreductase [Saccharopolyspora sp. CA-218241]|uniref:NAD(P)-dependent oxidoreductase n=1 Tax=Saccharopolyspora sp. CA-218241 TaxID=3240027 RepID=UPI003D98CED9